MKLSKLVLGLALLLAIAPATVGASTGNEVAIETIELYSPITVGKWVVSGKATGCQFTTDPGTTITMYMDQKQNYSPLLLTEPGERCFANTRTGEIMPFFMGTSMATPAVVSNNVTGVVTKTPTLNGCLLEFQIPEKFKPTATTTLKTASCAKLDHVGAYNFVVEIEGINACNSLKEMAE